MKNIKTALRIAVALAVCHIGVGAQAAGDYARTKYPIVLAHGMLGFDKIGPIDYWNGIPDDLQKNGAKVYLTRVSAFGSSEARGEQLLAQVEEILAVSGAAKVNLIGHSHGNHSVRYVAGVLPGRVASATSVSGPTKGSHVADLIAKLSTTLGPTATKAIAGLANAIGRLEALLSGGELPQDALGALASLSSQGAADFNRRFPGGVPASACGEGAYSHNGVRYYSWSGTGTFTNLLDPSDMGMAMSAALTREPNDGMVPKCSSHLGMVIRDDYNMNHLDTVNHVLGLVGWGTNPVAVYRQHANRLKLAGL